MQNNLHNSNLPDTIVGATAFEDDLAEFLLTEMTPTPKIRCDESLKTILEESSQQITFSVLQIPSHSRDRQSSTRIISRIVSKPPPNTPFVGHTSSAIPYSTYPVSLSLLQPNRKEEQVAFGCTATLQPTRTSITIHTGKPTMASTTCCFSMWPQK
jgi:hypothetical protein